jgi:hypothetical protein
MIIQPGPSTQLLITQPDHAALAAAIMRQWSADRFQGSPRRADILVAIAEHDNGWREVDAAPLIERATGRVLDFIHAPDAVRQGVWPRGVERLADTPYTAALVAQHAIEIYARNRQESGWGPFFAEMEAIRDRHLQRAGADRETLDRDYFFLRTGDLISLTFCNVWTDEQRLGSGYTLRSRGSELAVSPDPFAGRTIPIAIAAVEVPAAPFASEAAARDAFACGRAVRLTGILRGVDHVS